MLSNYKIRVNNEAESKEAQWLFCVLGGSEHICDRFGIVCLSGGKVYTDRVEFFEDYDDCEEITIPQLREMVSAHRKPIEQVLISCADAKLAWAKGEELEFYSPDLDMWFGLNDEPFMSDVFYTRHIRIKPSTVKIEIEIPKPFEPKNNEIIWCLNTERECGYKQSIHHVGVKHEFVWRSEEQIKQVVAALRSALTSK